MTPADYQNFHQAWINAHAMSSSNQEPRDSVVMAVFDTLIEYPIEHVLGALKVHSRQSSFAPTPAHVVEIIDRRTSCKHIGADEAWAIVLTSFDEFETVVMTQEMMDARKAVYQIWADGDTVGARMAFRDAYSRIIQIAGKPKWQVISGFDAQRWLSAIESAKQLGRLPADYQPNQHALPAPQAEISFNKLLDMAEKNADQADSDLKKARVSISRLREILNRDDDGGVERRAKERQSFEHHRETELSKLAQKAGSLH